MNKIATLSDKIINILQLNYSNYDIYLGQTNIDHMIEKHPEDYTKYGMYLEEIINNPDYVGLHKKNSSIELVKMFKTEDDEYVKVAIRISGGGKFFARSLYTLNNNRVENFIAQGTLISLK